jgi:hypothetical protein
MHLLEPLEDLKGFMNAVNTEVRSLTSAFLSSSEVGLPNCWKVRQCHSYDLMHELPSAGYQTGAKHESRQIEKR